MKQTIRTFVLTMLVSMLGASTFAHDIAVENADGVTIYYNWRNTNELQVTYKGTSWTTSAYSGDIVIPSSVTIEDVECPVASIENWTFSQCNITSVTIPNSVTEIEPFAFLNCYNLTSVTLPNKITKISDSLFSGCSKLTSVVIPEGVTSIGGSAFKQCSSLKVMEIPVGVTSIDSYAFNGCSSLESLTIPNSVITFGKYDVFKDCTGLKTLNIDCSEVQSWFKGVTSLQEITIGSGVNTIASNAFAGCTGIQKVTLHCSEVQSWFSNQTSLEGVILGEEVTTIDDEAFLGCTGLTTVNIPEGVTTIGTSAFSGCSSLESLTIPSSVTSVGYSAFAGCTGLTSVTVLSKELGAWFKKLTSLKEVVIGEGVTIIGDDTFYGCTGLTTVTIPEGVTTIGENAFYECSSLASVTLPSTLTSIGSHAFWGCRSLLTMTIPTKVATIGTYAFFNTYLKSLTIGAGVRTIGTSAFGHSTGGDRPVKVIWMTNTPPDGYQFVEGRINYVSNDLYAELTNVKVYPYLSSMFEADGVKYVLIKPADRTCDAIDCVYDVRNALVDIKPTTTYRGITLSVKNIQPYIFYGNTFVQNAKVAIGGDISECAFAGCSNMQQAVFDSTDKDLGEFTGLFIGKDITSVGDNAFAGCAKLNNLNIDDRDDVLTLGNNGGLPLFNDCPFDAVYIGGDISYQTEPANGYSPFYRNAWIRTVVITDKETEVSPNEFYGCSNLQDFTVGDGVTTFGDWCFSGCLSLKNLTFGSKLAEIGREAFSDCAAVTKIVSNTSTPPVCGTQAMDDISKFDCTLYVPEGSVEAYQAADQWKEFFFTAESAEEEDPLEGDKQCAIPTITTKDGKMQFECETSGVIYHYQLYMADSGLNVGNFVDIPTKCMVKVYASKEGYKDSDYATKEIVVRGLKGDVNEDGKVTITDAVGVVDIILGAE